MAEADPISRLAHRDDEEPIAIPVTWYRGGTSKVFFVEREHVADMSRDELYRWMRGMFGSPDRRQIDGVGGADQVTSKFAILGPPTKPGADIDYAFFQVGIDSEMVATDLNCGNVTAAVGLYAIDNGYVPATDGTATVRIHNVNDGKTFYAELEVRGGRAVRTGSFHCEGVPGTGAPIALDFREATGGRTGKLLPTGNLRDRFTVPGYGEVEASIIDIANLIAFVPASAFGLQGNENPSDLQSKPGLQEAIEYLRGAVAHRLGLASSPEAGLTESPGTPFISLVSPSQDWRTFGYNVPRQADECDFMARGYSFQAFTRAYWGTGTITTGVAAALTGTTVNALARPEAIERGRFRIAHPSGTVEVVIALGEDEAGGPVVEKASFLRTARKIMDGTVYVSPEKVYAGDEADQAGGGQSDKLKVTA